MADTASIADSHIKRRLADRTSKVFFYFRKGPSHSTVSPLAPAGGALSSSIAIAISRANPLLGAEIAPVRRITADPGRFSGTPVFIAALRDKHNAERQQTGPGTSLKWTGAAYTRARPSLIDFILRHQLKPTASHSSV